MSRSYPIWNRINSCIYNSGKSYGIRDHGSVEVMIGTSAKNSHPFLTHTITRTEDGDYTVFRFFLDGMPLKIAHVHRVTGAIEITLGPWLKRGSDGLQQLGTIPRPEKKP